MNIRPFHVLCACALTITLTACGSDTPETTTTTPTAPVETTMPQAMPQGPASMQPESIISGTIVETQDAGGYTYMLLDKDGEQQWVAIPQSTVSVGDEVGAVFSMIMTNFESKTLGRTFDEITFASGLVQGGSPSTKSGAEGGHSSFAEALQAESPTTAAPASSVGAGSSKAVVPFSDLSVEKAPGENSYTVGELFTRKAELSGKQVAVRGKVMKVSLKIMGKNWLHIQDGSGDPAQNTHDLVVTTDSVPEKDSVVIALGILAADKDFGAGYKYSAIIEDAQITQ